MNVLERMVQGHSVLAMAGDYCEETVQVVDKDLSRKDSSCMDYEVVVEVHARNEGA